MRPTMRFRRLRLSVHFGLYFASVLLPISTRLHAAPQQASLASVSSTPTPEGRTDLPITVSPGFSAQDLAALPTKNWLKVGDDLFSQNYSPLKQVNRENIAKLKAVWQTHLDGSGLANKYSGEAQPMVYEGVLYIVTGADDVFAISVKTGETLWKYQANLDQTI